MGTKTVTGWSRCGGISFENIVLPAHRVVCPRCDGEGKHVNPAIDGNGLSAEDLADDGFREDYFSGVFDVRCEECNGERVVMEIDEEACKRRISTWKGLIRYWNGVELEAQAKAEWRAEMRATGCL